MGCLQIRQEAGSRRENTGLAAIRAAITNALIGFERAEVSRVESLKTAPHQETIFPRKMQKTKAYRKLLANGKN